MEPIVTLSFAAPAGVAMMGLSKFLWSKAMTPPFWACGLALAASSAMAQGNPVFTAQAVHPLGAPVLDAVRDAELTPTPHQRPIARGETARAHAVEVAEVFNQACLQGRGVTTAASDWALNHGFTPLPEESIRGMAKDAMPPGQGVQPVSVFVREADAADTVMLMLGEYPLACSVVTRQAIDGPHLRDRMAQLVARWVGQKKPPVPTVSLHTHATAARTVGYRLSTGRSVDSLVVTAPSAVGSGLTLLALSSDDAPPAR